VITLIKRTSFLTSPFFCLLEIHYLLIPPAQIQFRYGLITDYVGASVDDITVSEDGNTHYLNGKPIS
jgi:hypothetical protein